LKVFFVEADDARRALLITLLELDALDWLEAFEAERFEPLKVLLLGADARLRLFDLAALGS
jgi:hypothetical protein